MVTRHMAVRARRAALAVGGIAVLGLLTACGSEAATSRSAPDTMSGTAQPATDHRVVEPDGSAGSTTSAGATRGSGATNSVTGGSSGSAGTAAASNRCHTSELRLTVGPNHPGAGQENFALVLTNSSGRTCTVHGYPGAAFQSRTGAQLGPDPVRSGGPGKTVTLAPGKSAWAGLSFSNPQISEATTATPAWILVTPPDETVSLRAKWTGGQVPVAGDYSTVRLSPFSAGTGE